MRGPFQRQLGGGGEGGSVGGPPRPDALHVGEPQVNGKSHESDEGHDSEGDQDEALPLVLFG